MIYGDRSSVVECAFAFFPDGENQLRLRRSHQPFDSNEDDRWRCGTSKSEMSVEVVIESDACASSLPRKVENLRIGCTIQTGFAHVNRIPILRSQKYCCSRRYALIQKDPLHAT